MICNNTTYYYINILNNFNAKSFSPSFLTNINAIKIKLYHIFRVKVLFITLKHNNMLYFFIQIVKLQTEFKFNINIIIFYAGSCSVKVCQM
jgi:hypothetical protein